MNIAALAAVIAANNFARTAGMTSSKRKAKGKAKRKRVWSYRDTKGRLCVDCSECERGGNGSDPDKCSAGWMHKRGGRGSCFGGVPMPGIADAAGTMRSER